MAAELRAHCTMQASTSGLCRTLASSCRLRRGPGAVKLQTGCKAAKRAAEARGKLTICNIGQGDGDFGARDPYEAELASNFSDKVLGNFDTEHIVKPPEGMARIMGLKSKRCVPCEAGKTQALTANQTEAMRQQAPGWRLVMTEDGMPTIRQDWKVRNFKAALELFGRIGTLAEEQGHHPDLHVEGYNNVSAVLCTHSVGGLTENDFIMAVKINDLEVEDLMPKKKARFWA